MPDALFPQVLQQQIVNVLRDGINLSLIRVVMLAKIRSRPQSGAAVIKYLVIQNIRG